MKSKNKGEYIIVNHRQLRQSALDYPPSHNASTHLNHIPNMPSSHSHSSPLLLRLPHANQSRQFV